MEKHTLFILFNYRWKHRQSFQKDSLCTYYLLNLIALDSSLLGINCTVLKQGKINCKKNNFGLEEKQNILLYFGIIILCLFIYDRFSFRGKKKPVSPGMASNTIVNCIAIGAEKNKQTNIFFSAMENILLYVFYSKKLCSFFTTFQASEDSFIYTALFTLWYFQAKYFVKESLLIITP